jgi:hypothetical protein
VTEPVSWNTQTPKAKPVMLEPVSDTTCPSQISKKDRNPGVNILLRDRLFGLVIIAFRRKF